MSLPTDPANGTRAGGCQPAYGRRIVPAKEKFLTEPMRRQMLAAAHTALRGGWLWPASVAMSSATAMPTQPNAQDSAL